MVSLLVLASVLVNDSAVLGQSGSVSSLNESTPITMVSENIQIDVRKAKVVAQFEFKNTSNAPSSVKMGFPEEGWGDAMLPDNEGKTWFRSFSSWVDGAAVKAELWRSGEEFDSGYRQWWVKTVDFAAGQTRIVKNEYATRYGENTEAFRWVTYVLETGAPWHGKIGKATITADVSSLTRGSLYIGQPKPTRIEGTKLIWELSNFEPTADDNITVTFATPFEPRGISAFKVIYPDYLKR